MSDDLFPAEQIEQVYPTIGREELIALRRQFIMGRIIAGMTTDKQIADAWNEKHPSQIITPNTVYNDRKIVLDELNLQTISDARQMRNVLAARINTVIRVLENMVEQGNLKAIDRYLKANQNLADLFGSNMPAKIAFTDTTGTKSAILMSEQERLARVAEMIEMVKRRTSGHYIEENIIDAERVDN